MNFLNQRKKQKVDRPCVLQSSWESAFGDAQNVSPAQRAAVPRQRRATAAHGATDLFGAGGDPFDGFDVGGDDPNAGPARSRRGARLQALPRRSVTEDEHWDSVRPALEKQYAEFSELRQHLAVLRLFHCVGLLEKRPADSCEQCTVVTQQVLLIAPDACCIAPVQYTTCERCAYMASLCSGVRLDKCRPPLMLCQGCAWTWQSSGCDSHAPQSIIQL